MLRPEELVAWFRCRGLPESTQMVIQQIRGADSARRVGGGRRNVVGRYPSRKMGVTIQFESHRVGLAAVYELEHDSDVLEYYDQPTTFKLDYESASGKRMGILHTPDYFVIRKNTAGWEECKTEEELGRLSERNPNRYREDGEGHWRCPPGEAYAQDFGFYYRVRSSRDINWLFQRNIQFLEDYLRADSSGPVAAVRETALALVSASPGITLSDLFDASDRVADRDSVYWMVALGLLHVDLEAAAFVEPEKVHVFPNKPVACAPQHAPTEPKEEYKTGILDFNPGSALTWDGKAWKIANVGHNLISLVGEEQSFIELPLDAFETLVVEGRLRPLSTQAVSLLSPGLLNRITEANENDLLVDNQRFQFVNSYLRGEPMPQDDRVKNRTLRMWVAQYQDVLQKLGIGLLCLRDYGRITATGDLPVAAFRL